MRRRGIDARWRTRLWATGLLLLAVAAASDASKGEVHRPGSFVAPAHGRYDALTLTTFLTDAADLHYAVVPSGYTPLSASEIKTAAKKTLRSPPVVNDPPHSSDRDPSASVSDVVCASTVTVHRASKVETVIQPLDANTSFDVYFVAEVIDSNGVFGPVQSVLASTTHPKPPAVDAVSIVAANASADAVVFQVTLSAPGRVYIALSPSGEYATPVTQEELSASRSLDVSRQPTFALQEVTDWALLRFNKSISGLLPSTLYDAFIVTEAAGGGGVRGEMTHLTAVVRTHSLPPELRAVRAVPKNGTAFALNVSFQVEFRSIDLLRVTPDVLPFLSFNVYFEAVALTPNINSTIVSTAPSPGNAAGISRHQSAKPDKTSISEEIDSTIRGSVVFGNFSTLEQLRYEVAQPQVVMVDGLANGTEYQVALVTETVGSNGLFSSQKLSSPAKTHQVAPVISTAVADPSTGTVHALTVQVNMSRPGNIHYVVMKGRAPGAHELLRATSISQIRSILNDGGNLDELATVGVIGLEDDKTRVLTNRSERSKPGEYSRTFQIDELRDATHYSLIVIPETIDSFGVFGAPYQQVLDAVTHENASDVELRGLRPVPGSTSGIEVHARMTKALDILFFCIKGASSKNSVLQNERCEEADRTTFEIIPQQQHNGFHFTIANLSENTKYDVSLYAESALRNRVYSSRSFTSAVQTHQRAPRIEFAHSKPVGGSTSKIQTSVVLERGCLLHYVARPIVVAGQDRAASDVELPIKGVSDILQFTDSSVASQLHHSVLASIASSERVFFSSTDSTDFETTGLTANTTYELYLVAETSRDGDHSGVLGDMVVINVSTHVKAPTLVKATADPAAGTTDSVVIAANLSHPGIVHYFLSDADFADPAVIRVPVGESSSAAMYTPHTMRGEFVVSKSDIYLEIINGTNDTGPTDPPMYVKNLTITGLKSGATYHVSLTTESFHSDGVFGEFPPPVLVSPHRPAPRFVPGTLKIQPAAASSSSIDIAMRLERFGEVHFALFFRQLKPDRSDAVFALERARAEEERRKKRTEMIALGTFNASNYSDGSSNPWPPASSTFDLHRLNGPLLKAARLDDLGAGVWENGSISVSREDVIKGEVIHKRLEKLPPNAVFDVCLVSETAGGSDVFNWNSSESDCHRVVTHADYTNQSVLFDEVEVTPIPGRTDGVHIVLHMSKLLNAPPQTPAAANGSVLPKGFAVSTGRTPRFILMDGKGGRRGFDHNSLASSHRGRDVAAAFHAAIPGHAGVAATGVISTVVTENDTFITLEHSIYGLRHNSPYLFFFAYETVDSGGVFTTINPHKHRSNQSRSENDGIEVVTHEAPPRLSRAEAGPTFGNTSSITVKFDITCDSCDRAIVHILAYPKGCAAPPTELLLPMPMLTHSQAKGEEDTTIFGVCGRPLAKRKVKIAMPERQHSRKDVEEDISGSMEPNSSYVLFLAAETFNSSGVVSDHFLELSARTHAVAPSFQSLQLTPRKGSTTELLLQFSLNGPGEVHYMLGRSDNSEFNVTSALNISSKGSQGSRSGRTHKSGPSFHNYARDVVRIQRSVKVKAADVGVPHTEVLDYLSPGTAYDAYVVVEDEAGNGVYGSVERFHAVATFSNAPILLAHAVNPTPGSTSSLTVGFRLDAPGSIYFSVVTVDWWDRTRRVALGSDKYGNRLAMQEKLVAREHVVIEESGMQVTGPGSRDSGWREKTLSVPYAGANYTVHLVTETSDSEGVYGIVATHRDVQSHAVAPVVLNVTAAATDARMDSLTIAVRLSGAGHVHYAVLIHGEIFSVEGASPHASAGSDIHVGVVNLNESACVESTAPVCVYTASFEVDALREGTAYDVYVRTETLDSFGVFGEWRSIPVTVRTHGLPPAILHELECLVKPSCAVLHREPCSSAPNVCGECLDGFSEPLRQATNEPCVEAVATLDATSEPDEVTPTPRTARIKINGVILNTHLATEIEKEVAHVGEDAVLTSSEPEITESSACPMNARPGLSGGCECLPGFEVDVVGTSCVLPDLPTAAGILADGIPFGDRSYSSGGPTSDSRSA